MTNIFLLLIVLSTALAKPAQTEQEYIITVGVDTRKPIHIKATSRIEAAIKGLRITVLTAEEWKEAESHRSMKLDK